MRERRHITVPTVLAVLMTLVCAGRSGRADFVKMKSGTVFYGKAERQPDGTVHLTTPNGGRLPLRPETYEKLFEAEKHFEQALEALEPGKPEAYLALGQACARTRGAEDLALRLFSLAAHLADKDPRVAGEAHHAAASLMLRLIELQEERTLTPVSVGRAADRLRLALHRWPEHEKARQALKGLKGRREASSEALLSALEAYLKGDYEYTRKHIKNVTAEHSRKAFQTATGTDWEKWCRSVEDQRLCTRCKGKGQFLCPKCRGRGQITCSLCKGEGSLRRRGGKLPCYRCRGEGKVGCDTCRGDGKLNCPTCEGTGFQNIDEYRQRRDFMRACRTLSRALDDWDAHSPLLSRHMVLPGFAFEDQKMTLLGTRRPERDESVTERTVFLDGRWLTPRDKKARMDAR